MCCSHDALSRYIHTCNEWQTRYSEVFHLYAYMQTYCYIHEWYKLPKNCYHLRETFGRHFPANGIHGILLIGCGGERERRKEDEEGTGGEQGRGRWEGEEREEGVGGGAGEGSGGGKRGREEEGREGQRRRYREVIQVATNSPQVENKIKNCR